MSGRDIPIIFSGPMIRALLDGRKTMTRRLLKPPKGYETYICDPAGLDSPGEVWWRNPEFDRVGVSQKLRYQAGDLLWVKEDLRSFAREPRATVQYVADITGVPHRGLVEGGFDGRAYWNWKTKYITGRYCPRWASRLTLTVTATKIERLQEISHDDAVAEGVAADGGPGLMGEFMTLWEKLHGADAWDANPDVVALTFAVHKRNIDSLPFLPSRERETSSGEKLR